MSLKKYGEKRTLSTPEPKAKMYRRKEAPLRFVVQKHAASHLHYDFRLEVDGVLKSWAVPKGPSMDPSIKRLAMAVEDHPFDYRNFEGIIPQGYGAGTVMIWDYGTYTVAEKSPSESEKLMREGLKKGHFHFILNGTKLKGEFILIKMNRAKENEWLLMKKSDSYDTEEDIVKMDRSAVSGKTLSEIGNKPGSEPASEKTASRSASSKIMKSTMPRHIKPMLATLADGPFDGSDWIFEIKLDGFRAIAEIEKGSVNFYSRNSISFNSRFPNILKALRQFKIDAVFDGEIVGLDSKGISHFRMVQNSEENASSIYFYIFDLLFLEGKDLRRLPLIERKSLLRNLFGKSSSSVRYLDHVEDKGKEFYAACKKLKLEGIIAKRKTSPYRSGERSREWLKIKIQMRQEVIVCGYTEPKKSRKGFGALVVAVHDGKKLRFAGHVGGGFTEKELSEIKKTLDKDTTETPPIENPPKTNTPVTWVKPKYICEVEFKEWTSDGIMRQPVFIGLRSDKLPKEVKKEKAISTKEISMASSKEKISSKGYSFITHPEKLFWEKEKITKGDVLDYYKSVSPYLIPYLKDRPEVLKRYPDGIGKPSFYQKNLISHPEWITTVPILHQEKTVDYLIVSTIESLLYAANLGCLELHAWLSRYPTLDYPDFMVFDLDPEDISFESVTETALVLHELLEKLKIPNFCKTSGATGLHIAVPLGARYTFEQSKNLALIIANLTHAKLPKITSLERSPKNRQKKVYIDCLQNNFGQSIVAPFSLRAKPGAPVSMPIEWTEVERGISPSDYTIFNALKHIESKGDSFKGILKKGIDLKAVLERIESLPTRKH